MTRALAACLAMMILGSCAYAAQPSALPSVSPEATPTPVPTSSPAPRATATLTPDQEIQRIFTHSDAALPVTADEFLETYNAFGGGAFTDRFDVEEVEGVTLYQWTDSDHGLVVAGFSEPAGGLRMMSVGYLPDRSKDAVSRGSDELSFAIALAAFGTAVNPDLTED